MDYEKEINRVIGKFIWCRPVLGMLCLRMKYEKRTIPLSTSGILKPIGVNPVTNTVIYDPDQLNFLKKNGNQFDLEFMLAHEAMHILIGSLLRKGDRDQELWNLATDFEVNYLLKDMEFTIPEGALYNPEFHSNYYYAEKIYELLLQQATENAKEMEQKNQTGQGDGSGNGQGTNQEGDQNQDKSSQDDSNNGQKKKDQSGYEKYLPDYQHKQVDQHTYPMTAQEINQAKTNTQNALSTAVQAERNLKGVKNTGIFPNSVHRLVDQLLNPQVTWKDLLYDVTTTIIKNNYSYRRCNPYYRQNNIYVPTLYSPESKVVVIVDTSGSIHSEEMRLFISEVSAIMHMFNTTFISCDADVYVEDIVENATGIEDILNHIKGGGGTYFTPAFKWIEENVMENCTVVLMTDGYNADRVIPIPFSVEKTIVLTTSEKPSGFEPDVLIKVELHPKESW